ncbi:hypothetical protein BC827DRAFT_871730 [Russula dissimulans]|nr:hypothetical protein BC827DRAFT_871730 [Russula dissimulans]
MLSLVVHLSYVFLSLCSSLAAYSTVRHPLDVPATSSDLAARPRRLHPRDHPRNSLMAANTRWLTNTERDHSTWLPCCLDRPPLCPSAHARPLGRCEFNQWYIAFTLFLLFRTPSG